MRKTAAAVSYAKVQETIKELQDKSETVANLGGHVIDALSEIRKAAQARAPGLLLSGEEQLHATVVRYLEAHDANRKAQDERIAQQQYTIAALQEQVRAHAQAITCSRGKRSVPNYCAIEKPPSTLIVIRMLQFHITTRRGSSQLMPRAFIIKLTTETIRVRFVTTITVIRVTKTVKMNLVIFININY